MRQPKWRFWIGYALTPKKQQSFIRPSLLNLANERGLDLIEIQTDKPLIEQGPFDCIIHKLYTDDWKQKLNDYKAFHPICIILDAPESIERLHNRISMLLDVSKLTIQLPIDCGTFSIPRQIIIYDNQTLNDHRSWADLKFPLITKPLIADGSDESHKLSMVYNATSLKNLEPPIVLQEFINYGGIIFKVYVVGSSVKCIMKRSLIDESDYKVVELDDSEKPLQKLFDEIAKSLKSALNLNLFNFKIIRDSKLKNKYLIIDINYFPGYAKLPSYETIMVDFLCDVVFLKGRNVVQVTDSSDSDWLSSPSLLKGE